MYVPLPARRTEAPFYAYPDHLRGQIEALPRAPGVYLFHAEGQPVPLYVGKSVDIRGRVLAHMRTPNEARLLRQTDRISHLRTAGDLGAQLLESQLIKRQLPLFNKKLRGGRATWSLRMHRGDVAPVQAAHVGFGSPDNLHGLFGSRAAALQRLHDLADENRLCLQLLGLERARGRGLGCLRASLDRCAGACCGRESMADHGLRLLQAMADLRLAAWPYPGTVGLVERGSDMTQVHLLRDWHYLGSVDRIEDAVVDPAPPAGFDPDSYRILCDPILGARHEIVPIASGG